MRLDLTDNVRGSLVTTSASEPQQTGLAYIDSARICDAIAAAIGFKRLPRTSLQVDLQHEAKSNLVSSQLTVLTSMLRRAEVIVRRLLGNAANA